MTVRPLEITSLTKTFDTPDGTYVAVKDFTLRIQPGEFVSLLGHSGCGKSTVLSVVAGLQDATLGGVVVDGREVSGPGLERGVVFQSPSLLPWMSALDNVMLAAREAHPKLAPEAQRAIALRYMNLTGVAEFAKEPPSDLSQGAQQRVAIARALALEPRILLLDEPFGMLDSMTRFELQDLVLELWERDRKTVLLVTHDVDEAIYLSDRIVLMTDGPAASVGLDLRVGLPRPRDRGMTAGDAEYLRLRGRVIEFLEDHGRQFRKDAARPN